MSYRLVVFDWDGTLMDSADRIVRCFRGAAEDLGVPVPDPDRTRRLIGLGLREAFAGLFPDANDSALDQLCEAYRDQFLYTDDTVSMLFPGVPEGLERLKSESFMLSIATGKSRRGLERALRETGLSGLFSATRCVDEALSKPHPRMLLDLLSATRTDAGEALMVGDTTFDMAMAAAAGMDGLAVGYGAHPAADLLAENPRDLVEDFAAVVQWVRDN